MPNANAVCVSELYKQTRSKDKRASIKHQRLELPYGCRERILDAGYIIVAVYTMKHIGYISKAGMCEILKEERESL